MDTEAISVINRELVSILSTTKVVHGGQVIQVVIELVKETTGQVCPIMDFPEATWWKVNVSERVCGMKVSERQLTRCGG